MSAAPQPDGQPINRAAETLRQASENEALELDHQDVHPVQPITSPNPRHGPLRKRLAQLWRRHISMAVPHVACRDHLGEHLPHQQDQLTNMLQQTNGPFWGICALARCSR